MGGLQSMKPKEESRVLDMTKGKPFRLLLTFAMPLFLGNLLQQFYNLADTSIAGHVLGDKALAQIGATSALYSLITNFAFGINNGMALTVSRYFGAGSQKKMKEAVCWMVSLSLSFSFVLTLASLVFRHEIIGFLRIPGETAEGALSYLTVILAGIPLTMAYNMESSLLQAVGNSITPLLLLMFSSILNVALDFLFMGTLRLGVRGAAAATVLAQGISAFLGLIYICRNYTMLRFGRKQWSVSPRFVAGMIGTGLSMAFMSAIYNLGSVALQSSINALGNVYIAAQVGGRRLAELFYIPGLALGTSVATYSSQNYGAGKRERISKGIWSAVILYGLWWPVALSVTFFAAPAAVRMITGTVSQEVVDNAVMYLRISIPMIPPMAVLVILRNAFQGMGHPVLPLFCSGLELVGKIIFAFFAVPVWGYTAVCICEPVTWVICVAFILGAAYWYRDEFK